MYAFGGPEQDREKDLKDLSYKLCFTVEKVEGRGDAKVLIGKVGNTKVSVSLASTAIVLNPRKVEEAVYDACGRVPDLGSRAQWKYLAEAIARLAEEVEGVPTVEEETRSWVRSVLTQPERDRRLHPDELYNLYDTSAEDDFEFKPAAWREGHLVYVRLERLAHYLTVRRHQKLSHRDIGKRLADAGFKAEKPAVRSSEGKSLRRQLWGIAASALLEDEGAS